MFAFIEPISVVDPEDFQIEDFFLILQIEIEFKSFHFIEINLNNNL